MTAGPAESQERRARRVESTPLAWWEHALEQTTRWQRRGALTVCSMKLADEVQTLLESRGIPVEDGHVVVDPGMRHLVTTPDDRGDDEVVMLLARLGQQDVVVPICPATPSLRVYARSDHGSLGELVITVPVAADGDGWTTADAIVTGLTEAGFGRAPDEVD